MNEFYQYINLLENKSIDEYFGKEKYYNIDENNMNLNQLFTKYSNQEIYQILHNMTLSIIRNANK